MRTRHKGVTLIELLVVMTVFGVLSLVSWLAFTNYAKMARDAKRKSDLEKIRIVLYDYYFDNDCFPESFLACGGNLMAGNKNYLANFPCDYQSKPYAYQSAGGSCPQWFKALTNLENSRDSGIDKVGCRFGCGEKCDYNYGLASTNVRLNQNCIKTYACTPSGGCYKFIDPVVSRCPITFENDPTCQNACNNRGNRCHDERGKQN